MLGIVGGIMSRVAKKPVVIPNGVEVKIDQQLLSAKGSIGKLEMDLHDDVSIEIQKGEILLSSKNVKHSSMMIVGTMRSLVNNLIIGVSEGFEKKLELRGVGYRAKAQGNFLSLTLGFSHPVNHEIPDGVVAETPTQTEIVIKGMDKQKVGQVASDIRSYRPPEPYKGKGVRYFGEKVIMKEAKKK